MERLKMITSNNTEISHINNAISLIDNFLETYRRGLQDSYEYLYESLSEYIEHNEIKSFITFQENFNMGKYLNIILENIENNIYFNIEKNTLTFSFEESSLIVFDKDEILFFIGPGRDVVNFIISVEKELCFNIIDSTEKIKDKEINKAIEFYVKRTLQLFKEVILDYIQKHWYEANLKNV